MSNIATLICTVHNYVSVYLAYCLFALNETEAECLAWIYINLDLNLLHFLDFKGVKMLILLTCSLSGPCLCLHCCLSFFIKLHFCTESRDSRLVIDTACQQSLHHSVFNVPFHVSNFECTYIQILIKSEYRETVYVNEKYVIK